MEAVAKKESKKQEERRRLDNMPSKDYGFMKVADLKSDNAYTEDEKSGVVIFEPIDKKRFISLTFRRYRDPKTDIVYGIPTGRTDKDGTPEFQKIQILNARILDRSIPKDRMMYKILKNFYRVEGTLFPQGEPSIRIKDMESESKEIIEKGLRVKDAMDIVYGLHEDKVADFCRLIGENPKGNSVDTNRGLLVRFTMDKPVEFLEIYKDENRTVKQIIHRGIETGIITHNINDGYMYKNGVSLGHSIEGIVEYLVKDTRMMDRIDKESRKETGEDVPVAERGGKSYENGSSEKDRSLKSENESLKRQLDEMRRKQEELLNQQNLDKNDLDEGKDENDDDREPIIFKGRPVTGRRGDDSVWKQSELLEICEELGCNESEIKSLRAKRKDDIVEYIKEKERKEKGDENGSDESF